MGPQAVIGKFNMLNSPCTIGHHTKKGDFNFIGPEVVFICFNKIGNDTMFGGNRATIPAIKVGTSNTIAAKALTT